jgi:excisionase family DNA binding protein
MSEVTGADLGLTTVKGRMLTVKEVADFLRVSERTIEKRIKAKLFPFEWVPFGARSFRADSKDVDAWLRKIKISAGIEYPLPKRAERKSRKRRLKPDEEMNPQGGAGAYSRRFVRRRQGFSGRDIMNLKRSFYQSAVSVKEFGERMGHHAFSRLFCGLVIFVGKIMLVIPHRFTVADLSR